MRKILAIESKWYENSTISVRGFLEILRHDEETEIIHYQCDSREQLQSTLDHFASIANVDDILYIASHGKSGAFTLNAEQGDHISLTQLAQMMGRRFGKCAVILSGCNVLATDRKVLKAFIKYTRIRCLGGYTTAIDWVAGAAMDMLVLYEMQYYKRMKPFWKSLSHDYRSLIRSTGFKMVFPS